MLVQNQRRGHEWRSASRSRPCAWACGPPATHRKMRYPRQGSSDMTREDRSTASNEGRGGDAPAQGTDKGGVAQGADKGGAAQGADKGGAAQGADKGGAARSAETGAGLGANEGSGQGADEGKRAGKAGAGKGDLTLEDLRQRLNQIDRQLISLVAERKAISGEVARVKRATGRPTRDYEREKEVILNVRAIAHELGV